MAYDIEVTYLREVLQDFSIGKLSMLDFIERIDLGPDATYDDYCDLALTGSSGGG